MKAEAIGAYIGLALNAICFGYFIYLGIFSQDTHRLVFAGFCVVITMIHVSNNERRLEETIIQLEKDLEEDDGN